MRSSRFLMSMLLVLYAPMGLAQNEHKTEAQQDGLVGSVKSVSTIVDRSNVRWQQPGGPTLLIPIWCQDCEYSPEGFRTRSGQIVEGKFIGDLISLTRDANGRVTEVLLTNASNGEVFSHRVMGPFGKTAETDYQNGKLMWQQTLQYDPYGQPADWITLDDSGAQIGRSLTTWTKPGEWTSRTTWGKDQQVSMRDTYDPAKDEQHFTTYDESGNVTLAWTYAHGQVPSFWAASDSPNQFGDKFVDFNDKANPKAFHCHNGACEASQVHYEYADAAKQNLQRAEWRDASGSLVYAAYYSYEFDQNGNWTHRQVWVLSPDLAERTLYETDARLVTYWEK
jgi:hypothetical protein